MATLFVGNLPWDCEEAALKQLFSVYGNIVSLSQPVGRQGRSRGYAIVEFSSALEASSAVQRLHGAPAPPRPRGACLRPS
jgi:nucleolin